MAAMPRRLPMFGVVSTRCPPGFTMRLTSLIRCMGSSVRCSINSQQSTVEKCPSGYGNGSFSALNRSISQSNVSPSVEIALRRSILLDDLDDGEREDTWGQEVDTMASPRRQDGHQREEDEEHYGDSQRDKQRLAALECHPGLGGDLCPKRSKFHRRALLLRLGRSEADEALSQVS